MESDSDLIQTALANLTLPDYFPDWLFSQNSMADAQRDGFPLPSATRSVRTDSVLRGIRVGFLKPIEHLILDDSISEVMVNGGDRVFIEKAGYLNILGRFIPDCPIERSRATSPTRSMLSFRSSGGRDAATSRKSSKSTAMTPMPISSIIAQSTKGRRHSNDPR